MFVAGVLTAPKVTRRNRDLCHPAVRTVHVIAWTGNEIGKLLISTLLCVLYGGEICFLLLVKDTVLATDIAFLILIMIHSNHHSLRTAPEV